MQSVRIGRSRGPERAYSRERNAVGCYTPISNSSCISNSCPGWHNIDAEAEVERGGRAMARERIKIFKNNLRQ